MRIDLVTGGPVAGHTSEVWRLYDRIFGDQPDEGTWRGAVWDKHTARDGFRLALAYDEGVPVGFGYGYTGDFGQWWTDRAAQVLDPRVARDWLGGHFELVSIGVLADARGQGIGSALMRRLTDGLPHERWLLMTTADPDDPARRLYARHGWRVIGPGLTDDRVIMGKQSPDLARAKERAERRFRQDGVMDAAEVHRWVADYERVWRTEGTDALREIFTDDATYLPSPWATPITGMADLAAFWDSERDGPDEDFTMTSEVVAVDADRATAVVRVTVDYRTRSRWRDLWVVRFAEDGRCRAFEEWPFAPAQPDGH